MPLEVQKAAIVKTVRLIVRDNDVVGNVACNVLVRVAMENLSQLTEVSKFEK